MITTKKCSLCKEIFPKTSEFFHRDSRKKDGFRYQCKICRAAADKKYREENMDKIRLTNKKYSTKNRDKKNSYMAQYYIENKERILKQSKERTAVISEKIGKSIKGLHDRIRRKKQLQTFCTICNDYKKELELSSIEHTYTENPNDYWWLCRSCHVLYDNLIKKRLKVNEIK